MTDWKNGLQKAAEDLALSGKPKAQTAVSSSSRQVSENSQEKAVLDRSPRQAIPGMPDGFPAEARRRDLIAKSANADISFVPGSPSKGIRSQAAMRPPLRCPSPPSGVGNPVQPPLSGLAVQPPAPAQEPRFEMPEMSRYEICHGSSGSLEDQSWQELGIPITLGQGEDRGRAQCILGLDFGTAFTKACIQFRHSTYVVHWNGAVSSSLPFLLPGVFSIRRDGACVLGMEPDAQVCSDLKMGLLAGSQLNIKVLAVVFLALVTRYIRSWLFAEHRSVFSGFHIEWFVNVGLPAVHWDNFELKKLYKEITVAAWRLGASQGPINLSLAASSLSLVEKDVPISPDQLEKERVCAFPEFVAQINSYRRSAQRRRDLHLLLDIGAGTIDIVTFHTWEPEDGDCYSILEAAVEKMGTHVLLAYRACVASLLESRFDEALSRLSVHEFEAKFGLSAGKLRSAQNIFANQISYFLETLLRRTREARYATSPRWHEGVPFFVAGGGHRVDAYRQAIDAIKKKWHLEEISLPVPEAMVWGRLPQTEFHRVSVAYGLSDSAENIGLIERRSEVPNLCRAHAAGAGYSERYIEK